MSVFEQPAFDRHEQVHFIDDAASGLRAIIAIHSTARGPAAGGCRRWRYESSSDALVDVLRLSRGMSYKNAVAGLPLGGGKSVILQDRNEAVTTAQLEAFGRAIEHLAGRYVTAEDVGIGVAEMARIATATRYVSGLPGGSGDPSPKTAHGVFHGLRAAVRAATGRRELDGLTVAVQGLGGVGYHLCAELHAAGAKLVVADLDAARVRRAQDAFGARPSTVDGVLFEAVDVLAPCALGGVLNAQTIPRLQARIVAGGANNQLLVDEDGESLRQRGILYAPDYVINAGGIISVAAGYLGAACVPDVDARIVGIGDTLAAIFEEAAFRQLPTSRVADALARRRLAGTS